MITDEIREALQWHSSTGRDRGQPDRLYLGARQHDALMAAAEPFRGKGWTYVVHSESHRIEYNDMKVYRVDADSFIGFGHDDPSPAG